MNKYLKLLLIFAITGAIVVVCSTIESKSKQSNSEPQTVAQWQQKYPAVFANAGYQSLIESNTQLEALQHLPESQQELIGVITNPFGIRDDILDYILINIPESDSHGLKALLFYTKYTQEVYYSNLSQESLIMRSNDSTLMAACLDEYYGVDKGIELTKGVNTLMRDTKSRNQHLDQIDQKVFGWSVLGGLTSKKINEACFHGKM